MKIRSKIILLLVLISLMGNFVEILAQEIERNNDSLKVKLRSTNLVQPPSIISPSPQSEVFEKYIYHPVTEYNGLPEINIPLYEIEIKGLKIPISLSYHASGIKYKQYDGDVGAGWSINAEGYRISRSIYGKPDELYPLFDKNNFDRYVNGSGDRLKQDIILARIGLNNDDQGGQLASLDGPAIWEDGELDRFTYQIPSSNGMFVISDRIAKKVDFINLRQDSILLDENTSSLLLDNIKVLDNRGFNYYFGGKNQNNSNLIEYSRARGEKTSWPLRSIKSPFNEEVNFKYNLHNVDMSVYNHQVNNISDAAELGFFGNYSESSATYANYHVDEVFRYFEEMYFIEEIKTEKEVVRFIRFSNSHFLKEIVVSTIDGIQVKKIEFNYTSMENHQVLASVKINEKLYSFDYYELGENIHSLYPDQWGYYKSLSTELNTDVFIDERFKNDQYFMQRTFPHNTARVDRLGSGNLPLTWVDMETNEYPHYYSLKKITYPTGGFTTYEYEPNQYKDSIFDVPDARIVKGAGQRIKKITSYAAQNDSSLTYLFKYGENEDGNAKVDYYNMRNIRYYYSNETYQFNIDFDFHPSVYPYTINTNRTYSVRAMNSDSDLSSLPEYSKVTVYQYGKNDQYNGKTESFYSIPEHYVFGRASDLVFENASIVKNDLEKMYINRYSLGRTPTLELRLVYDKNENKIQKEEFQYHQITSNSYYGVKIMQKAFFNIYHKSLMYYNFNFVNSHFQYLTNILNLSDKYLKSKTLTQYYNTGDSISTSELYTYNYRNLLTGIAKTISESDEKYTEEYKYPTDFNETPVYREMVNRNMLSPVIEQITKKGSLEVKRNRNEFSIPSGGSNFILPASLSQSFKGNSLSTEFTFDLYDSKGNLKQVTDKAGFSIVYLWGYNYQYPIAEIKGVSYTDVTAKISAQILDDIAKKDTLPASDSTSISKLRIDLPKALITTYTYKPLYGVATVTDPRGVIIYYDYDTFGRLKNIRDKNKYQVEAYEYHYQNQ